MKENRLKKIECNKCEGKLIMHGIVWDDLVNECRIGTECLSCRDTGILIVKPKDKEHIQMYHSDGK